MKFIKAEQGKYSFQIARPEREVLFNLLELYPLIPVTHARLTRFEDRPDDQQLLEESLNEQRKQNRLEIQKMLKAKSRFRENKKGFRFSLKAEQVESLLQVLNDLRVGSWLMLGSPDGLEQTIAALDENNTQYFWTMELATEFQVALLNAMNGGG